MCTQTTHKGHKISTLKDKIASEEIVTSLTKWKYFFDAKKEEFNLKKTIIKKLEEDLEKSKNNLNDNLEKEHDKLLALFEKDKGKLSSSINEVYLKEKNLMTQTKAKIEKQAIKLRSFIAEMECFAHDINKLSNQEILEIDLNKISELNVETADVILESVKSKNTNFKFKDFNPIEDCLLKKFDINLSEHIEANIKIAKEAERLELCEKLNLSKRISDNNKNANEKNNINDLKNKECKSNGNLDNFNDRDYFNDLNLEVIANNGSNLINKDNLIKTASFDIVDNNKLLNENVNLINDATNIRNLTEIDSSNNYMQNIENHFSNNSHILNANDRFTYDNKSENLNINIQNLNISPFYSNNNYNNNENNYISSETNTNINTNPLEVRNSPLEYPTDNNNDLINIGFNNSFRMEESNNQNPNNINQLNNPNNTNLNTSSNNLNNINNNNNSTNYVSNNFLNNSFYRKNSFTNTEIINTTNINFIPYNFYNLNSTRKNSNLEHKIKKSSEKTYINNLNNNNSNLKYKIIKNEDDQELNYNNYLLKKSFYDLNDISDLILFIGDSKDKSILLFNKKNFSWKKLENSILGEYEFLDYCCLTKFGSESAYLISGGCIYSNYKNTAVNSTYLAKIIYHKENFLVSFIPFKAMNKPRFSHGSCALRGKAYVFGGHDGSSTLSCIEFYDNQNNCWKYLNETDDKNACSEMNVEREIFASCVIDDRFIYVFGGFNDIHLDSIERFDVESGKWHLLTIRLNNPLQNSTACYLGNKEIAIIGGYNGSLQRKIEILNFEKNIWVENYDDLKLVIPRRRAHCYKYYNKVRKFFLIYIEIYYEIYWENLLFFIINFNFKIRCLYLEEKEVKFMNMFLKSWILKLNIVN